MNTTQGESAIAVCPCGLCDRNVRCARGAALQFWSDLRRPDPAPKSGVPPLHKSMTTSWMGWEQQTGTLSSAGLSSGSGSQVTSPETKPLSQL
jgi:hypothetical protein